MVETVKGIIENVNISLIVPNDWNPNKMTPDQYEKEKNSILTFGFIDPITVREVQIKQKLYYQIIDGEHRWRGAKELGMQIVTINNLGHLSDEQAQQMTLQLNAHGKSDILQLGVLVHELRAEVPFPELEKNLPFDKAQLENLDSLVTNLEPPSDVDFGNPTPLETGTGDQDQSPDVWSFKVHSSKLDFVRGILDRYGKNLLEMCGRLRT